jgi:transposase
MSKQRRSLTAEFKREAAFLVLQQGDSDAQACLSLGVGETAIPRWVDQLCLELGGVTPRSKALTPE